MYKLYPTRIQAFISVSESLDICRAISLMAFPARMHCFLASLKSFSECLTRHKDMYNIKCPRNCSMLWLRQNRLHYIILLLCLTTREYRAHHRIPWDCGGILCVREDHLSISPRSFVPWRRLPRQEPSSAWAREGQWAGEEKRKLGRRRAARPGREEEIVGKRPWGGGNEAPPASPCGTPTHSNIFQEGDRRGCGCASVEGLSLWQEGIRETLPGTLASHYQLQ